LSDELPAEAVTNRAVAQGAGTTLLARLGGVIDIVAQPLYLWMFGLAGYGIYVVLWSAINLIENVADLGMTAALQRTVPKAKSRREAASALRAALIMGVGPCFAVAVIVAICAPLLANVFNAAPRDAANMVSMIRTFVWALPLWAFVEIATSGLRAQRAFGPEIRLRLLWEQVARLAIAGGLWSTGLGTMALLYAHLASLVLVGLLCVRMLRRYFDLGLMLKGPIFDKTWNDTAKAGIAVLPNNIVGRIFGDAPQIVLNAMIPGAAGASAAGLFVIARKISSIVQLVRIAFSYVLAPLASLATLGERASIDSIYGYVTRISFALVLPLGATLAAGGDVILVAFGNGAHAALPALVLLTLARMIEAMLGNAATIQQVIGGYRGQIVGSITGLIAAAVIFLATMPDAGLLGASSAVAIGMVVATLVPLWQVHHYDGFHPFAPPFARVFIRSAAIALGSLILVLGLPALPVIAQLPILLAVQLVAVWLSLRLALMPEDRATLGKTARLLRLI
jgi:O-antigen/teichoic acid export membrane protein